MTLCRGANWRFENKKVKTLPVFHGLIDTCSPELGGSTRLTEEICWRMKLANKHVGDKRTGFSEKFSSLLNSILVFAKSHFTCGYWLDIWVERDDCSTCQEMFLKQKARAKRRLDSSRPVKNPSKTQIKADQLFIWQKLTQYSIFHG